MKLDHEKAPDGGRSTPGGERGYGPGVTQGRAVVSARRSERPPAGMTPLQSFFVVRYKNAFAKCIYI